MTQEQVDRIERDKLADVAIAEKKERDAAKAKLEKFNATGVVKISTEEPPAEPANPEPPPATGDTDVPPTE